MDRQRGDIVKPAGTKAGNAVTAGRLEPICGVMAPILTPFNSDLTIAHELFADHAHHLIKTGCAGLAPFGTTGEALSLGIEERIVALERLIDSGIDPKKLIPGTGLTNLPDTIRLTRHAVDCGCAGVMVLPPFYFKNVPDEGLFTHFARLIEHVSPDDLRIYLYHIPPVAQVDLSIDLIQRLRSTFPKQIVGIKDSSGDWDNTRRLLTEVPGLIVYPGSELLLLEALSLGAAGCITATANINASSIAEIVSLHRSGKKAEATQRHEVVKKLRMKIQEYGPIPAQKYLLSMWSGDHRWRHVRPPLVSLPDTVGHQLSSTLEREFAFAPSRRTSA